MKIFLLTLISIIKLAVGQDECLPARCEPFGPLVRFPFRLKDRQPENCGRPEFELSCNQSGRTELNLKILLTASTNNVILPLQMTVIVWEIDYVAQKMLAGNARMRSCLPEKLPAETSSGTSLFEVEALGNGDGYILFNCSNARDYVYETIPCLSGSRSRVIPFSYYSDVTSLLPHSSCFKMYNISYVPDGTLTGRDDEFGTRFYLRWSRPSCGHCEAQGKYCRSKYGGNEEELECFSSQQPKQGVSRKHKLLIAGGILLMAVITVASFFIIRATRRKKNEQKRIDRVLADHKNMRPKRYSYAEIKKSTKNFKEKLGALHRGMLSDGTPVAVKLLKDSKQNLEDFITEVERIGGMQNVSVLQLIGYCADEHNRAIVYEFSQGGTLEALVSSEKQSHTLGWEKLLQIALGIARGVEYVHQESDKETLSLDINPHNIFLDHNLNPKMLVSTTSVEPHSSWLDISSQKADVYSFGMLWLDIIGRVGGFACGGEKEKGEAYFPEWFYSQQKKGEEAICIDDEGNDIAKKVSIVGLHCIQWFPSDRPSMKAVIQMLQEHNIPTMPPNPFTSLDHKTGN